MQIKPYKSVAGALLFSVFLGPIGLLYASFWGGLFMIFVSILLLSNKYYITITLVWLLSCIWSVRSVDTYNKKLLNA